MIRGNSNTFTHVDLGLIFFLSCVYIADLLLLLLLILHLVEKSSDKIIFSLRRKILLPYNLFFFFLFLKGSQFSYETKPQAKNFILCAQIFEVPIKKCYNHTCGEKLTFSKKKNLLSTKLIKREAQKKGNKKYFFYEPPFQMYT